LDFKVSLDDVIDNSFGQYAGAVIQSRALVDVRDCVKPSTRQVLYCMFTDKFTHDKPFKKTLKAIGSCMRLYIHGDASCEGIVMRSGQPFSMRYPLVEVEGSYGTLTETGNWAAPRYTASRLSQLSDYLLKETDKYTVDEWVDNYDDTEKYPRILSSLGFYNIVNGTSGIASGLASSVPQFNLKEVNAAMVYMLEHKNAAFDDILCYPDFATGGTILNKDEVRESLKIGKGKGCIVRAKLEYDKKDNCIIVRELPYSVYTNTICNEIEKITNDEETNPGIVNLNDLTGENVCIKIYLSRSANPKEVATYLFDNTSLQKTYSINMTMLENGRYPKVFGWQEALTAHLKHEKQVYTNMYKHQLNVLNYKLKITNGIIAAINKIDETVETIKNSSSTKEANEKLQFFLGIDEDQAKAILEIKLVRLAKLEVNKLLKDKENLESEIERISSILNSNKLLKQEMIKRFNEVSEKFGDERRTKVVQKEITKTKKARSSAPKENRNFVIAFNPLGYLQKVSPSKYKSDGSLAFTVSEDRKVALFSNKGRFFRIALSDIKECGSKDKGTAIGAIINLDNDEKIITIHNDVFVDKPYMFFVTEDGKVKKCEGKQFAGGTRNVKGSVAFKTDSKIVSIQETNGCVVTLTSTKRQISFMADSVRASSIRSGGMCGIKLDDDDRIVSMTITEPQNFTGKIANKGGRGVIL
jgi:DNA gyrase subunit A